MQRAYENKTQDPRMEAAREALGLDTIEPHPSPTIERTLEALRAALEVETLDTRNSDTLDFHTLAVWQIEDLIRVAHDAEAQSANRRRGIGNLSRR